MSTSRPEDGEVGPRAVAGVLAEGRIVESRPGAVMLAAWGLGIIGMLLALDVFTRPLAVLWGWKSARSIFLVIVLSLLILAAVVVLIQVGLLRGRLTALVAALHALGAILIWEGQDIVSFLGTGSTIQGVAALMPRGLCLAIVAGFVLALLIWPGSLRWFIRAHGLRRRAHLDLEDYVNSIKRERLLVLTTALALLAGGRARADEPGLTVTRIFEPERKHNHASCVVELPGGDLFAAWYRGTGEREADDVEIWAARLKKGDSKWGERFLLADTPGYPDCNPALFAAPDRTLWLLRPVILDHRWEGALLKFSVATEYPDAGRPPRWSREGVLHVTPAGFDAAMAEALKAIGSANIKLSESAVSEYARRSKDLLYQRLGWMPRVHPIALASGRWVWPLYCDTFSCSIMAITDDQGATWKASAPMIGFGNIQPSLVRKDDGTLVAFMRDAGPAHRIRLSTSKDDGETWSKVVNSELPNPGAGIEAIRLADGSWALIYNDTTAGRHSLAVSLSDDEGATWKWTRHVAVDPDRKQSFHYPSMIQATDGLIHATYTHGGQPGGSSIDHARFDASWIRAGDGPQP
jgi:predicted neuraminidase